jgi:hypothetical protein
VVAHVENARHARPLLPGADAFRGGAAPEQQPERVHHDGLAAAGLAREQVQPGVKAHPEAVHHRVIFDHQFEEHSPRL